MSKGVLLDRDAALRTRDAVRKVEQAKDNPGVRSPRGGTNRVWVRITEEVTTGTVPGEYKCEAVKRDDDDWDTRAYDRFTDDDLSLFEFNGVTGIEVDTVVEAIRFFDNETKETYWGFVATGGTSVFPVKILGKVEAPNNPDEDRWYCEVYPDGKHGDPLDPVPPLNDLEPTVDAVLYILTIDTGTDLPNGQLWTLAIRVNDVDAMIDTPHDSTPGFHYEGQIPMWFCEP
jgi:hypothetical protein